MSSSSPKKSRKESAKRCHTSPALKQSRYGRRLTENKKSDFFYPEVTAGNRKFFPLMRVPAGNTVVPVVSGGTDFGLSALPGYYSPRKTKRVNAHTLKTSTPRQRELHRGCSIEVEKSCGKGTIEFFISPGKQPQAIERRQQRKGSIRSKDLFPGRCLDSKGTGIRYEERLLTPGLFSSRHARAGRRASLRSIKGISANEAFTLAQPQPLSVSFNAHSTNADVKEWAHLVPHCIGGSDENTVVASHASNTTDIVVDAAAERFVNQTGELCMHAECSLETGTQVARRKSVTYEQPGKTDARVSIVQQNPQGPIALTRPVMAMFNSVFDETFNPGQSHGEAAPASPGCAPN